MTGPNQLNPSTAAPRLDYASFLTAIFALLILVGCGTTSALQTSPGTAVSTRKFSKVTVQDFKVIVPDHAEHASSARTLFPDRIAAELTKGGRFSSVRRNATPDPDTLVIDGLVTKYDEGSTQKRLWLGMGFGMAFLEGKIYFRDSKGNSIGAIKVDKNSWPLGGAIGAIQNPESFMNGAADKVAEEATKLAR